MTHVGQELALGAVGRIGGLLGALPFDDLRLQRLGALIHHPGQLLGAPTQAPGIEAQNRLHQPNQEQDKENKKPARLIKAGLQNQADRRTLEVPDTVVVGGDHMEAVGSGAQIVVIGDAARAGIHPVLVVPLKLIFEPYPGGNAQAHGSVMKLDLVLAGRNLDIVSQGHIDVVDGQILNQHGRNEGDWSARCRDRCGRFPTPL